MKQSLLLDTIKLLVFEVRLIQAAKTRSSSCPRKKVSHELWPICQTLLASKYGNQQQILDLQNETLCRKMYPSPYPFVICLLSVYKQIMKTVSSIRLKPLITFLGFIEVCVSYLYTGFSDVTMTIKTKTAW